MVSSIDGLVSGLSTSSMISSLLQVEAAPQTALKTKVTAAEKIVGSYQSVNSKLSTLKGAADDITQLSTWRSIKPTSSSPSVTATAIGGLNTSTGTISFDVVDLAKAQVNTARVPTTGNITDETSIFVKVGTADAVEVKLGDDRSAQGVSDAINKAGLAVKASVVTTGGATNVLQLSGSRTGAANSFTVTGLESSDMKTSVQAQDAKLQVGGADADGGFAVTSATNTFTGLMAGVTVTVGKQETGVTLSVAANSSGIADKFQAMVDAANGALSEIGAQTAYNPTTKKGSPLTGDFMVRQMSSTILSAVSNGLSFDDPNFVADPNNPSAKPIKVNFGSLSKLGIELDRSGQLTFDKAKFEAAYNADPTAIKTAGIALGDTFEALANKQSENVTSAITGRKTVIDNYNTQISNWDVRLVAKREALQKQYAGLETALSKLQSQSTWLSGQIASLG